MGAEGTAMSDYPIWIADSILYALRSSAYFRAFDDDDAPLTPTDQATLEYVRTHPGEETGAIAVAFGIKRSAMHTRLGRLVARGLVQPTYESNMRAQIARWRAT